MKILKLITTDGKHHSLLFKKAHRMAMDDLCGCEDKNFKLLSHSSPFCGEDFCYYIILLLFVIIHKIFVISSSTPKLLK